MELWKPSGQRREPQWQLSSQEPVVHFHKPQKNVPQINVEPLNSARDVQLPGTEATASFTDWCLVHRQQSREQKKNRSHCHRVTRGTTGSFC